MRLSVAMIVKNEEKNLDRTLKALHEVTNEIDCEIIIVDTGSSDSTMDIAKKYTDKVYEHEWTGNFSEMRNISIGYCTGDWILVLDADEVLVNPKEMISFLKSPECQASKSASIKIKNIGDERGSETNAAVLIRMFRNIEGFGYTGKVHEQPKRMFPIAKTNIEFLHYGYSADDYELMNYKFKRNIKLLHEELETADDSYRIYVLFQLSKSYAMAKKEDIAFKYIKMSYDLERKHNKKQGHVFVYHWYACMLYDKKDYQAVIDVCKEMMRFTDDNMDIYYMMAMSYSSMKKYKDAYKCCSRYFEIKQLRDKGQYPDNFSLSESSGRCAGKVRCSRIICYYKEKRYKDIIKEVEANMEEIEDSKEICGIYIYACIYMNRFDKVKKFYKERENDDAMIEMLINNLSEIEFGESSIDINEVKRNFAALDERFNIYFNVTDNGIIEGIDKIDFSTYYSWKEKIIEKAIVCNDANLELMKDLDNDVIKCYIYNLINVYENLEIIYNYCKDRFLVTDISKLTFVCDIENVLLFNKSIKGDKYKLLVLRALINRHVFRKKVFNENLLRNEKFKCILDKHDRFYLEVEEELKKYSLGRVNYLKNMNALLKKNEEYTSIIKMFLREVNNDAISNDMIAEKNRIVSIIEKYIYDNKIYDAEQVIREVEEIFKWEKDIYNCKGIINYIKGEYSEAIFNLALAAILMDDKFDPIYNIACVLEKMNRVEDSIAYYEEALKICSDDNMKLGIEKVLEGLR